MRVPIIAGNWKMHKDVQEAVSFIEKVKISFRLPTNLKQQLLLLLFV